MKPLLIVAALLFALVASGWRTASDATRDEQVRQELKWIDRDAYKMEQRIDALEARVKALESK